MFFIVLLLSGNDYPLGLVLCIGSIRQCQDLIGGDAEIAAGQAEIDP